MKVPKQMRLTNDTVLNVISILMIIFVVMDVKVPNDLVPVIDSLLVKSILIIISLILFMHFPIVGAISLIFVFELFRRSMRTNSSVFHVNRENEVFHKSNLQREIARSNNVRDQYLMSFNQFPKTLEEEVVQKMVPLVHEGGNNTLAYKPIMSDIHQAAKL